MYLGHISVAFCIDALQEFNDVHLTYYLIV